MPHEFKDDTLGDIRERDIDNWQYVIKNAKEYTFTELTKCISFCGEALNGILQKHGLDIREFLDKPEAMDVELARQGIIVEHRDYDQSEEEDRERSGIYVYKKVGDNSEIVGFVGKPQPGFIWGSFTVKSTIIM
jgi:hypothetical protein